MPGKFAHLVEQLIEDVSEERPVHSNSLILTIFGDSICTHGGEIWLGSLIKMVSPLGINERLVRTSVFRLIQKGILQSRQIGRRSYYSLTEMGFRQFSTADMRIYLNKESSWDGKWRLVFTALTDISQEEREVIRKELTWLGFGRLAPGVFGHPTAELKAVQKVISERGLNNKVALMHATTVDIEDIISSTALVKQCFEIETMDLEYIEYIRVFEPILEAAKRAKTFDPKKCFLLRSLLIHKFRRILQREPELPYELVPKDSSSHLARELTQQLYHFITHSAENYLMEVGEVETGGLPEAFSGYYTRFGGLEKSESLETK